MRTEQRRGGCLVSHAGSFRGLLEEYIGSRNSVLHTRVEIRSVHAPDNENRDVLLRKLAPSVALRVRQNLVYHRFVGTTRGKSIHRTRVDTTIGHEHQSSNPCGFEAFRGVVENVFYHGCMFFACFFPCMQIALCTSPQDSTRTIA